MPSLATKAEPAVILDRIRFKPEGPLPSCNLPEHSPFGLEPMVKRRGLHWTARIPDPVRIGDRVLMLVKLAGAPDAIIECGPFLAKSAWIPEGHVPLGFAFDDPFGQRFRRRRRVGDADRETAGVVEIRQAEGRTAQRRTIGAVGGRAVHEAADTGLAQQRQVFQCGLQQQAVALTPQVIHNVRIPYEREAFGVCLKFG